MGSDSRIAADESSECLVIALLNGNENANASRHDHY